MWLKPYKTLPGEGVHNPLIAFSKEFIFSQCFIIAKSAIVIKAQKVTIITVHLLPAISSAPAADNDRKCFWYIADIR